MKRSRITELVNDISGMTLDPMSPSANAIEYTKGKRDQRTLEPGKENTALD